MVILFAVRLFKAFCREVFLFAVRLILLRDSYGPPYLWNSVPEDSWFFNVWVFMRTSTNFAHLTTCSFQAIEFMDWPVPKTLDIFVCQTSEKKAFKTQHSVTCSEREHDLTHPQSPRFPLGAPSTMTTITTWEEMKVRVRRIHWEIRLRDDK